VIYEELTDSSRARRTLTGTARMLLALKLDGPLLIGLGLVAAYGLVVLYSASGQSVGTVVRQIAHIAMGAVAMLVLARVNPNFLRRSSPWLYAFGIVLLLVVAGIGHVGKGAQRWLDLGLFRFQPSELMKLALVLYAARYLADHPKRTRGFAQAVAPIAIVAQTPRCHTKPTLCVKSKTPMCSTSCTCAPPRRYSRR